MPRASAIAAAGVVAAALATAAPAGAERRAVGNLVLDGIPEVPARIGARTRQYLASRGARLLDWDPAGKGILIATRFGEVAEVHAVAAPGADRSQLTFGPEPAGEAVFDPRQPSAGFYLVRGGEPSRIAWFDRKTGRQVALTGDEGRAGSLLPARAGGKVAFTWTRRNGQDADLYLASGTGPDGVKLVKELAGAWAPLDWSPDDRKLLLLRRASEREGSLWLLDVGSGELKEVNPQPGKRIRYAAAAFAGANAVFAASDEDSDFVRLVRQDLASGKKEVLTPRLTWDVELVAASRDGRWLAYTANEAGASSLYLAPAARPQKARRIAVPRGVISALLFDRASRRLGVTLSGAASEADVFAVDAPSGKVTRWTSSEVGGLDPATFVTPELIEVPSFDKLKIRAWYYRPSPSWRPARKPLPVVVSLHGGPEGESVASFSPIVQYLVNDLGAAVLAPNVRGSGGFGKKFLALDDGALREGAVKDLGALLDWIATRPELDKTRVAVIGGSYAGYLVLASLIQFGDRLRCGVATAAITNFVTFLARTEDVRRDARRQEYGDERDPRTRDLLLRLSPLPNAAALKQPLFVVHGLNDPRVPVAEVEQLVQTVRRNGAEVWYLLASDEGHGLQKRANLDFYQNAFLAFFERFLLE